MDAKTKKYIDSVWMGSKLGQFALLSASGKIKEANALLLDCEYPNTLNHMNDELSKRIAEIVKTEAQFDEYLRLLDAENTELVEFMITDDLLMRVYDLVR